MSYDFLAWDLARFAAGKPAARIKEQESQFDAWVDASQLREIIRASRIDGKSDDTELIRALDNYRTRKPFEKEGT